MTLGEQRKLFAKLLGDFLVWIFQQPGFEVAGDQWKRTQAEANANAASGAGITNSLHLLGLAVDLDFYIDGVYQTSVDGYRPLGEKWKSLHPLARWGGDFKTRPDADHFSLEWNGVQ